MNYRRMKLKEDDFDIICKNLTKEPLKDHSDDMSSLGQNGYYCKKTGKKCVGAVDSIFTDDKFNYFIAKRCPSRQYVKIIATS